MIRIDKQIQFELIIRNLSNLTSQVNTLKNELGGLQNKLPGNDKNAILTYQQQLSKLNKEAQTHYQTWKQTGDAVSKLNFDRTVKDFQVLNKEAKSFNTALTGNLERQTGYLGSLAQKLRSHFNWIIAGSLITAGAGIPLFIANIAKEVEVLNLKIQQNLELAERYHGNSARLEADAKHLTEVAGVFAMGYGANLKDVMEMMQILSRRFKSPEELTYYTNLALIMHRLDFVSPKQAAENLEAVILSMGLNFKEARQFIDEFSVAVHTARITGTDLLMALQRSGATFKNMNMNTAEAIAMISTLSTVVAKSGSNIGISLNSLLTNVDFKKGADALAAYKIAVYDDDGKMRQGVEIWRDMARIFNGLKVDDNDEKANKLALALSGGKFRINDLKAILGSWDEFEKILTKIQTQASPDLTANLLATGMKSYQTELDKLVAALQVLGVVVGNEVMPSLKAMTVGLATGVQYLIDNREEVAKVVNGVGKLVEILLAYRVTQMLANTALGTFITGLGTAALTAPSFSAGMATMAGSVKTFGAAVMATTLQMAALWAITSALFEMKDAASQSKSEKEHLSSLSGRYKDVDDISLLIAERDRLADLPGNFNAKRVSDINQQIRDKFAERKSKGAMDKVQQMVAEAEKNITVEKALKEWDKVGGQDIGGSKGGGSSTDPTSRRENRIIRDQNELAKNKLLLESKLAADQYTMSLDNLRTHEDIYGQSVASVIQKQILQKGRIAEIATEQNRYANEIERVQKLIDEEVNKRDDLQEALTLNGVAYKDLSKEGKRSVLELNSQWLNNETTLMKNYAIVDALTKEYSKLGKEANSINNNLLKEKLGDRSPSNIFNRDVSEIQDDYKKQRLAVDKTDPLSYDKIRRLELEELMILREVYAAREKQLKVDIKKFEAAQDSEGVRRTKEALTKVEIAHAEANAKIKQYISESKQFYADMLSDLIVNQQGAGDILKSLWKQIAKEAINQMMGIENKGQSILSKLAGGGKKGKDAGKGKKGKVGVKPHTGGVVGISNIPKFHSGGVVPVLSDETMGILRKNEEVNTLGERRSMAMMSDNMAQMMGLMQAMIENMGKSQGNGQPIIINAIDTQSFHDALRRNGDSVVSVIREQGYLGNK